MSETTCLYIEYNHLCRRPQTIADERNREMTTNVNPEVEKVMVGLAELRLPELQAKYAEVLGRATRAPNRKFLMRSIRKALEEQAPAKAPEGAVDQGAQVAVASDERPHEKLADDAEAVSIVDEQPHESATDEVAAVERRNAPKKRLKAPVRPGSTAAKGPRQATAKVSGGAVVVEDAGAEEGGGLEQTEVATTGAKMSAKQLRELTVTSLRKMYVQVVGRPTKSSNKRYLVWKIQQAQQGKVPVGPRQTQASAGPLKVLPLRMQVELVDALDDVRVRHGMKSRMALFRAALEMYLTSLEEHAAAGLVRR